MNKRSRYCGKAAAPCHVDLLPEPGTWDPFTRAMTRKPEPIITVARKPRRSPRIEHRNTGAEAAVTKIEKPAGIANPKDFRNESVKFALRSRAGNSDVNECKILPADGADDALRLLIGVGARRRSAEPSP
jgi:hypothetical protein